jgi:hypothetical protein
VNITLHAATEQVRELLDQIDPETGELPEGFEQARAIVATKAQAVTAYMLETERQAGMLKSYAKEVADRAKAAERRIEWLKGYLCSHMAACGMTEIKDERGIFTAKRYPERDEAVEVFDAEQVPSDYLREIPAKYEPDKALIKKATSSDPQYERPARQPVTPCSSLHRGVYVQAGDKPVVVPKASRGSSATARRRQLACGSRACLRCAQPTSCQAVSRGCIACRQARIAGKSAAGPMKESPKRWPSNGGLRL